MGCMVEGNGNRTLSVYIKDTTKEYKRFDWGVLVYSGQGLRTAIERTQQLNLMFGHTDLVKTDFLLKLSYTQQELDDAWEDIFSVHEEWKDLK